MEHEEEGRLPADFYGDTQMVTLGSLEQLMGRNDCTSCQDIVNKLTRDGSQPPLHSDLVFNCQTCKAFSSSRPSGTNLIF